MPKKRVIVHPENWSFLEFSSGAMSNNGLLLYNFLFAVRVYAPQAPVDLKHPSYTKTLEDNYSPKKSEIGRNFEFCRQ
ncbi:hypothetical protein [Nostoc sp.]